MGYNDKGRKLFGRIVAALLAVLMLGSALTALVFR